MAPLFNNKNVKSSQIKKFKKQQQIIHKRLDQQGSHLKISSVVSMPDDIAKS